MVEYTSIYTIKFTLGCRCKCGIHIWLVIIRVKSALWISPVSPPLLESAFRDAFSVIWLVVLILVFSLILLTPSLFQGASAVCDSASLFGKPSEILIWKDLWNENHQNLVGDIDIGTSFMSWTPFGPTMRLRPPLISHHPQRVDVIIPAAGGIPQWIHGHVNGSKKTVKHIHIDVHEKQVV